MISKQFLNLLPQLFILQHYATLGGYTWISALVSHLMPFHIFTITVSLDVQVTNSYKAIWDKSLFNLNVGTGTKEEVHIWIQLTISQSQSTNTFRNHSHQLYKSFQCPCVAGELWAEHSWSHIYHDEFPDLRICHCFDYTRLQDMPAWLVNHVNIHSFDSVKVTIGLQEPWMSIFFHWGLQLWSFIIRHGSVFLCVVDSPWHCTFPADTGDLGSTLNVPHSTVVWSAALVQMTRKATHYAWQATFRQIQRVCASLLLLRWGRGNSFAWSHGRGCLKVSSSCWITPAVCSTIPFVPSHPTDLMFSFFMFHTFELAA